MVVTRTAHPYRDTDVIDVRAPRFNQATVGVFAALALLTGWWWILGLLALQLILGLTLGRRFCLPCVAYFEVVQPWIGEGEIEDSRPPRFANIMGAIVLSAATLSHAIGLSALGWSLGGIVAGLALLAAITGLCVGCEIYRLTARFQGVRSGRVQQVDLAELGARLDASVVQFTHPLCSACREMTERLLREGRVVHQIDVSERPDLARKYHVTLVPAAIEVAPDGRVLETTY
jgi:hypothetical protein